jgi:hypothetical protein
MNEALALVAAIPAPVAGASAVSAGLVAYLLDRRLRRNRQRPGIRRHDGSGRVWEFAADGRPSRHGLLRRRREAT